MSGLVVFAGGFPPAEEHPLSSREREILEALARGESSRDLAERLGITYKTLQTHRSQILLNLRAHTMTNAVYIALRDGWIHL